MLHSALLNLQRNVSVNEENHSPMRRLGRRRPPPPWRLTAAPRASSTYTALPGASFHGASVEEMVAAAAAGEWTPPPLPATVAEVIASEAARAPVPIFGHALRDAHFGLDPSWTFLNHGAFGAPCRLGVAVAAAWRSHAERQPLKFIDRELFAHMVESQRVVAEWIGASADELVLVPNATTGLNAVIASVVGGGGGGGGGGVVMGVGDEVLYLDVGYGSVTTMLHRACRRSGARPVAVPIASDLPFSAAPSEVLRRVEAAMTPQTRMLIVDDVTSNTALVLPVAELCALCRSRGLLSVVLTTAPRLACQCSPRRRLASSPQVPRRSQPRRRCPFGWLAANGHAALPALAGGLGRERCLGQEHAPCW